MVESGRKCREKARERERGYRQKAKCVIRYARGQVAGVLLVELAGELLAEDGRKNFEVRNKKRDCRRKYG